jgi:hypothetical protein
MTDMETLAVYHAICLAKYSADQLRQMVKDGKAMPPSTEGGKPGFPIGDAEDVGNAVHAVGRGAGDHDAIRRHIIKNAKRLGESGQIPDNWNSDGSTSAAAETEELGGKPNPGTSPDRRLKRNRNRSMTADADGGDNAFPPGMADQLPATFADGDPLDPDGDGDIDGIPFTIPILCMANTPTGDGRLFENFDMAALPMPFSTQFERAPGHDKAIISGKITSIAKNADDSYSAQGMYDPTDIGLAAARLAANGTMPGVSVDADKAYEMSLSDDGREIYHNARIRGAIQLQMPAFAESKVMVNPDHVDRVVAALNNADDSTTLSEIPGGASAPTLLFSLQASANTFAPPDAWFHNPVFGTNAEDDPRLGVVLHPKSGKFLGYKSPTHIEPADEHGLHRVYGHVAGWKECHTGYEGKCVNPPASAHDYAYFHTGEIVTASGEVIACGKLTFNTGHPDDMHASAQAAARHYDDTGSVAAFVRCGEDQHGIWFSGVMHPDLNDIELATIRACGPSGDWRSLGGNLEQIGVLIVPTQGFVSPRLLVADGRCKTLVAAGAEPVTMPDDEQGLALRMSDMEDLIAPLIPSIADAILADID